MISKIVVANVGTTSSGAVDNFPEIQRVGTIRLPVLVFVFIQFAISQGLPLLMDSC